jgi:hypothetical protein
VLLALLLAATPDGGTPLDLGPEVRAVFDLVNCRTDAGQSYCAKQLPRLKSFRDHWPSPKGRDFLDSVEPKELPPELVYPFGGGDLMMALATFPNAQVITTLSLELAGDPRRLGGLDAKKLDTSLAAILETSASTLISNDSKSVNLSKIQQGDLPGQLSMHLIGLGLNGCVPLSARYFRIEPDGSLHYFTKEEVDALEGQTAAKLKSNWKPPDFSPAFGNVELTFTREGEDRPRIFRHIGANLHNDGIAAAPGVLKHLESKGRVTAMTKAASYLLWNESFSTIRQFLTSHARFMISDSTGVLPMFWPKGCTVKTFGAFTQSFLRTYQPLQQHLADEYAKQPQRALPMRFGYPDGSPEKKGHLMTVDCP